MTTKLLLAASLLLAIPAAGWAGEAPSDPDNCNLNSMQVQNGWTCTEEMESDFVSREIGGGTRCQDAAVTTVTYRGYNPAGRLDSDRVFETFLGQSDWGPSYPKPASGCTYPAE